MITYNLTGKAALITGAATGVGFATAEMLLRFGARVAVNYLPGDPRGAEAVAALQELGHVVAAPGNVADPQSAEAMVANAIDALGGLDLLVNNAGAPGVREVIPPGRLDLMTEELWQTLLQVNLLSVFRCSKAAATALKASKGAVVNVASTSGFDATGSTIAYCAAKAGVVNLTKNLARGLSPDVRVNAVAPGMIESAWDIRWTDEKRRASVERTLLKRIARPADIAEVITYLGFGASMVTGDTVVIDGGLSLG